MSSVKVGWDETIPANSDFISQGPGVIQSLKSSVRYAIGAEHDFPASGGSAGGHQLGSARVFVGPNSQVSSADTSGRLMIDSTNSQLWYVGADAAVTYQIGNQRGLSVISALPPLPAAKQFIVSVVSLTNHTWPSGPIGFGAFSGIPFVFASLATTDVSDLSSRVVTVHSVTASTCVATVWSLAGSASTLTATVHIMAVGII